MPSEQPTSEAIPSEFVLVIDDEKEIRSGLATLLGRPGRTVITCGDLESAEMIVDRLPIRTIVSDVRLSGPFAFEGLQFVDYVTRHAPSSRIVLMTALASPALKREAQLRGAVIVLEKPFGIDELEAALDSPLSGDVGFITDVINAPQMDELLTGSDLFSAFQPIVRVIDGVPHVFAYEALCRSMESGPLSTPDFLFEYFARKGCASDLELSCLENSIRDAVLLPKDALLFVNVNPTVLADARIPQMIIASAQHHGFSLARIVVEITEQAAIRDMTATMESVELLTSHGVRFAFDDVGVAYSHLLHLERIRPAFMKISQEFGTDFEQDPLKSAIVRNILSLANDCGCDVVLEGVERAETAKAAEALGIKLQQGYLFGKAERASLAA